MWKTSFSCCFDFTCLLQDDAGDSKHFQSESEDEEECNHSRKRPLSESEDDLPNKVMRKVGKSNTTE